VRDVALFEGLITQCSSLPAPMQKLHMGIDFWAFVTPNGGNPASACSIFCPLKCGNFPPLSPPLPPIPLPPPPPGLLPSPPPAPHPHRPSPMMPPPPAPPRCIRRPPPLVTGVFGGAVGGILLIVAIILLIRREIKKFHETKVAPALYEVSDSFKSASKSRDLAEASSFRKRSKNPTSKKIAIAESIFASIDVDKSGTIEFTELATFLSTRARAHRIRGCPHRTFCTHLSRLHLHL
jgi:hypothetical protein